MNISIQMKRALIVCLLMPAFICCSTYNTKLSGYYSQVRSNNYTKALNVLDNNRFINQKRNTLLYYLEKGKLLHLTAQYDSSNLCFNLADKFIEDAHKSIGDVATANLINPMVQSYQAEDFESFIIHYYKALNYYYLGKREDAIVEARRITLTTNTQKDKFANKSSRYSQDAFMLNLQGMLYEMNGDMNNAFIAYRNAVEVYAAAGNTYYDVAMPLQLKKDVIRSASVNGFYSEADRYKQQFGLLGLTNSNSKDGELIVFIEQGWGPEKKEQNFFMAKDASGIDAFYYIDEDGHSVQIPFDLRYYNTIRSQDLTAAAFRTFRIAVPYYSPLTTYYVTPTIKVKDSVYKSEKSEDLNSLAVNTLKERRLKEITNALARQIVKKIAEKGIEAGAKEIAKNSDNSKDDSKKKRDAEAVGAVAGLLVNIVNSATEKADTRSWQSIPAFISYVRIPLSIGDNSITLSCNGLQKTIVLNNVGGLHFYNWCVGN